MFRLQLAITLALGILVSAAAQPPDEPHPIVKMVKDKLKDPTKPFAMGIRAKIKAGNGEKFESAFAVAVKESRKEKGCLTYDINRSADDETVYIGYERWANLAALEAHLKQPYTMKLLETIHEVLDGAPDIRVFFPVGE